MEISLFGEDFVKASYGANRLVWASKGWRIYRAKQIVQLSLCLDCLIGFDQSSRSGFVKPQIVRLNVNIAGHE